MATSLLKPIEIDFKELGARKFETAEEVKVWADAEMAAWTKVREATKDAQPFSNSPAPQNLINHARTIRDRADSYIKPENEKSRDKFYTEIVNHLKGYSQNGSLYTADSPTGQKISELASTNPAAAQVLMARMLKHAISPNTVNNILEFVTACLGADRHDIDIGKEVERYRAAMTKLQSEAQAKFEETRSALIRIVDDSQKSHEEAQAKFTESLKKQEEARKNHDERMKQMETTFSTDMKLRSSERYWGAKRKLHENRVRARIKTMQWALPLNLIVLLATFYFIAKLEIVPLSTLSPASVFVFGVPTIIALWIMRLLISEYRENRDLAEDAWERVAMVYTYKALEYEEKVSDEERIIILQALFRPHGRKPEETLPNPAWEAVVKRVEGRGN